MPERTTTSRRGAGLTMQEEVQQTTSGRSILLVHGGDFKPAEAALLDISLSAIRSGIERDYPDHVGAYDALHKDLAYFGDLTKEFLESLGRQYDEQLDLGVGVLDCARTERQASFWVELTAGTDAVSVVPSARVPYSGRSKAGGCWDPCRGISRDRALGEANEG